jgi:hypothetical protein
VLLQVGARLFVQSVAHVVTMPGSFVRVKFTLFAGGARAAARLH